ncbi:MAG: hypothetical protein R2932_21545 [Caldilineaceae bacterium]
MTVEKQRLTALVDALLQSLQVAAPLVLLLLGAQQVLNDAISLGTMLALNTLALGFLTRFRCAGCQRSTTIAGSASLTPVRCRRSGRRRTVAHAAGQDHIASGLISV